MSESLSIDEGWEESLDSDQVTHVKGDAAPAAALAGEWLVNTADQVVVPMTTNDIVEALRTRRITERSLVWRLGMQDWAPLADVPPLRLATHRFAPPAAGTPAQPAPNQPHSAAAKPPPAPAPIARPAKAAAVKPASTARSLHPPPKEAARAARDERRRNTLPFGFPVVRDPATIREPAGLHTATSAARSEASQPSSKSDSKSEDSNANALAVYERATPSLTFADSVRAEWEGTQKILHQRAASAPPVAPIKPITLTRSEPKLEARPQPKPEPLPKIEPKPRLSLEPQSDPLQTARAEPLKIGKMLPPGGSLAPTTTDPEFELPLRGAGMWGDLSVVLASDLRAAKASSKRVALLASLGSALLASVLTLWFAHSSSRAAPEAVPAAQPQAAIAPPKPELSAAPTATTPATETAEPSAATPPSST
ncbi:MAG TPA: GYF domain-containing protein, partial [Polyangiaceae bacterium]